MVILQSIFPMNVPIIVVVLYGMSSLSPLIPGIVEFSAQSKKVLLQKVVDDAMVRS